MADINSCRPLSMSAVATVTEKRSAMRAACPDLRSMTPRLVACHVARPRIAMST